MNATVERAQHLSWDRKLALPMYRHWTQDEVAPWNPGPPDGHGNQWAGRIVIWMESRRSLSDGMYGNPLTPLPQSQIPNLCETDVVYCPLFSGWDNGPDHSPNNGNGFHDRLPERIWRANLAALKEFAPRVKAVLFGNLGCECAFARYSSKPEDATDFAVWQMEVRARRFIDACTELVREHGGRPAFALVPVEIQRDCFQGSSRLRDMVRQAGAILIAYNGHTLIEQFDEQVSQKDPEQWKRAKGRPRYKQLAEYFEPVECISGMGFKTGLRNHMDERTAAHGFNAGLLGWS